MADFLYNGVRLPKLPEVEGYPYKYVFYQKYNVYRYEIVYGAEPITAKTDMGGYGACVVVSSSNRRKLYCLNSTGDKWYESSVGFDVSYKGDMSFQWTSHDILFENSTEVYLAKSPDPVPVLKKGKLQCNTLNSLTTSGVGGDTWVKKTWNGLPNTSVYGFWTDGTNNYYSYDEEQYVLKDGTWVEKTWNGLSSFKGSEIWTDGTNVYCNHYTGIVSHDYYILDGDTWVEKSWSGIGITSASEIWSDGTNIYISNGALLNYIQKVLDGDTWVEKDWGDTFVVFADKVWSDGTNIYSSFMTNQYVLENGTWVEKAWNGLTDFDGSDVWTDGTYIYYSYNDTHYILNDDTWVEKTWNSLKQFDGRNVWTDGMNIYYSSQYVLTTSPPPEPIDPTSMLMSWLVGRRIVGMRKTTR